MPVSELVLRVRLEKLLSRESLDTGQLVLRTGNSRTGILHVLRKHPEVFVCDDSASGGRIALRWKLKQS